jgi:leucyl-tRNA synthetase
VAERLIDRYDFHALEPKWQAYWADKGLFKAEQPGAGGPSLGGADAATLPRAAGESTEPIKKRPKFFYLDMFPYPSGDLHMGHSRNYVIGDVLARHLHMRGYNVMHPMGWDAFGLPAENAAIERNINPAPWTSSCIAKMKLTFDALGISFDWSREVNASSPDYYKWTQWLFLQLYHAGLAYRGEATVNWCSKCHTVLAREELEGAACERCGTPVEIRRAPGQWFFSITKYAERLLEDDRLLDKWPERVRVMQENWIGRSEGVSFKLPLENRDDFLEVFTTRIDTIYGITFMALAAEHPLVAELTAGTEYEAPVAEFVREVVLETALDRAAAALDKKGLFTGAYCLHPLTGARVPIWVTNYVLMEYGTGAVMAVPAHDQRDLEFAHRYDIPVKVVIVPPDSALTTPDSPLTTAFTDPGIMVNSAAYDGLTSAEFKTAISDYLEAHGIGGRAVNYKLRDWLISRQRYWGCPIPIVTCEKCGDVPVPEADLPVLLPAQADFRPTGESPLARVPEFVNTTCPTCGGPAVRETDTMTTFVDSSWYYLRYASPDATDVPFRRAEVDYWLPVDKYVGGIEHAVRHLLYSRFITKVLYDLGHIGFVEPFGELFTQGMIYKDGAKMSKSKGNVVRPEEISDRYGTDTGRTFILFVGPPDQDAEWSDRGVEGCHRFLQRVWRLVVLFGLQHELYMPEWRHHLETLNPSRNTEALGYRRCEIHQTIRSVTKAIEDMKLNTMVSSMMWLTNELHFVGEYINLWATNPAQSNEVAPMTPEDMLDWRAVFSEGIVNLLHLLHPTAPHICDELWSHLRMTGSLYEQPWPEFDPAIATPTTITVVVQINSKVRDRFEVPEWFTMENIVAEARGRPSIQKYLAGKTDVKVIQVPKKLVNFVV